MHEVGFQFPIRRSVRFSSRADHHVRGRPSAPDPPQHLAAANFLQTPLDEVPSDGRAPQLRHHPTDARARRRPSQHVDVQPGRARAPAAPKDRSDLGAAPNLKFLRKRQRASPSAASGCPATSSLQRAYFDPTETTRTRRPLRRLRFKILRPALARIRARKPCLLSRFRFRGLYVGFIWRGVSGLARNEVGVWRWAATGGS